MKRLTILKMVGILLGCWAAMPTMAQDLDSLYAQEMLKGGMEAPDFMVDSTSNTRLNDLRGRYVVLHFWASWCPDCRKDMPEMVKLEEENANDSLVFIHISYDTDREKWWNYVTESGMQGLQFCEMKKMKESLTAQAFGIKWIPSMYRAEHRRKGLARHRADRKAGRTPETPRLLASEDSTFASCL